MRLIEEEIEYSIMATLSKNITEQQIANAAIDNEANFAGTEPTSSGQCYYVRDILLLPIFMCVTYTVLARKFRRVKFSRFSQICSYPWKF